VGKRLIYPLIKQESDVGNHTISMMCQVLSVSRPDYYRWLHKRERETKDLKERISRIWLTSEKRYGAGKILRKILQELVPLNRTCSIKRLQRLMKQLGIRSITRKKWRPVTIKEATMQEPVSGGSSKGKWEYMYTYGPYAFFKNTATGNWKTVQIISTTKYTINVIINGYEQTFERYLKGEYAAG
ncbi:IS3 family transposase, partial [Liquorilactobacillus ghanensis]